MTKTLLILMLATVIAAAGCSSHDMLNAASTPSASGPGPADGILAVGALLVGASAPDGKPNKKEADAYYAKRDAEIAKMREESDRKYAEEQAKQQAEDEQ